MGGEAGAMALGGSGKHSNPILLEDMQKRFGDVVCQPWPVPVKRAYVLALPMPSSSVQAVLVCGVSPCLPFDDSYKTFFQLVGARLAALLQSEIHQLEIAHAARRFRSLAEADPFGMVIGDLSGVLDYVNPAFLKRLGYSEADLNSGKVRWDDLTPPEYKNADAKAVEQLRTCRTLRCVRESVPLKRWRASSHSNWSFAP